ncbi:hypothetical protein D3C78_1859610 [compost metagenome]
MNTSPDGACAAGKRRRGSQDKARTVEKAEFTTVNEHFEAGLNAVLATQVVFHGGK